MLEKPLGAVALAGAHGRLLPSLLGTNFGAQRPDVASWVQVWWWDMGVLAPILGGEWWWSRTRPGAGTHRCAHPATGT